MEFEHKSGIYMCTCSGNGKSYIGQAQDVKIGMILLIIFMRGWLLMILSNEEKRVLIELICLEQTDMIIKNPESYTSSLYMFLERLKIKIKDGERNG